MKISSRDVDLGMHHGLVDIRLNVSGVVWQSVQWNIFLPCSNHLFSVLHYQLASVTTLSMMRIFGVLLYMEEIEIMRRNEWTSDLFLRLLGSPV